MMHRRTFLATGLGAGAALTTPPLSGQIKTPKPAPELVTTLNSGEQILLSKFRGKVVMLEFLLTTCPHCQDCSRTMQKVYEDLGEKFQPLGIAVNPDNIQQARMLLPQYVYALGLRFPVGYTNRDMAYQWLEAKMDGPIYFPQVVLIDRKGIIRHHFPGGDAFFKDEENNMRKVLNALIAEGATPKPAAAAGKKS